MIDSTSQTTRPYPEMENARIHMVNRTSEWCVFNDLPDCNGFSDQYEAAQQINLASWEEFAD